MILSLTITWIYIFFRNDNKEIAKLISILDTTLKLNENNDGTEDAFGVLPNIVAPVPAVPRPVASAPVCRAGKPLSVETVLYKVKIPHNSDNFQHQIFCSMFCVVHNNSCSTVSVQGMKNVIQCLVETCNALYVIIILDLERFMHLLLSSLLYHVLLFFLWMKFSQRIVTSSSLHNGHLCTVIGSRKWEENAGNKILKNYKIKSEKEYVRWDTHFVHSANLKTCLSIASPR